MKIVLSGARGFIGSYFADKYADKYEIEKFSFLNDDFNKLELSGFDVVLHMSALVHQSRDIEAYEYERVNVGLTLDFALKAKENGVGHFIFMSSIKVYGEEGIYDENSFCNPLDEYGKSKLKAELELQKLECDEFKVSIIRMPLVYGYGAKANIKKLIDLIEKIHVLPFGSIDNRRSMVYVGNLCHVIDAIIEKKQSGIFLASDDEVFSTSSFIELISGALGKKIYLLKVPFFAKLLKILKPNMYRRLYGNLELNNSLTKQKLNIKNPYSKYEAIKFMICGEE